MQLGQFVLFYQEAKGPQRAFAAEVIHVEGNVAKVAIFHPMEDFRILTIKEENRLLIGPRDTVMELREPNAKEQQTIIRMRNAVLSLLTDAERRAYENPADDGKKKKRERAPTASLPMTSVDPPAPKKATKKAVKKAVKKAAKKPAKH